MSIISSRFSFSVLLSAAVGSECVMAGVCLTNSSEVVLGADVDGVSGHKFEGSLKKVGPDHHNSLSTRSFPEQPLEGMSAGFMFPGQNLSSLCRSVYGSRPPYAERTASTACGS